MKILIDADGTNRTALTTKIAKKFKIPLKLYCDSSRILHSDYAEIVYSDVRPEATDITLLNQCQKDDIVITQDIGLASIALAKGAKVLHCSGRILNNKQIDMELMYRGIKQHMKKHTKHMSQVRKVHLNQNQKVHYNFGQNLTKLIKESLKTKEMKTNEME